MIFGWLSPPGATTIFRLARKYPRRIVLRELDTHCLRLFFQHFGESRTSVHLGWQPQEQNYFKLSNWLILTDSPVPKYTCPKMSRQHALVRFCISQAWEVWTGLLVLELDHTLSRRNQIQKRIYVEDPHRIIFSSKSSFRWRWGIAFLGSILP